MLELINLNEDLSEGFYKFINYEGYSLIKSGDCVAYGLTDDELPIGAIVADPGFDGVGEIVSICVAPDKRRQGYGTELVMEAIEGLYSYDNMYALAASFADEEEETGLKPFFEHLDFEIEEDSAHGAYSFALADIAASDKVKGDVDKRVLPMKEVLAATKNALTGRHLAVQSFLSYGELDDEISCIVNDTEKDPTDLSCLFVGKSGDDLVIAWAQAAEGSLDLINMLRFAIVNGLKKYGKDIKIRVPYINETSKKLIEKLVGDKAVPVENVWSAYLPLEWTMEGEVTEDVDFITEEEA